MFRTTIIAGVAALAAAAAHAQAADPATPPAGDDMRARLIAMDTDHDGRWSKAEWLAGGRKERGFEFMDANHDGYLTPEELRAGRDRMKAMQANK